MRYLYSQPKTFTLVNVPRGLDAEGNHTPLVESV